jgi:restriction endonuclease S subunit
MSFDLKSFDKSVNLNKRNNLKIESKWDVKEFDELLDFKIGGTPSREVKFREAYYKNGTNLWVSVSELNGTVITDTKEKITDEGVKKSNVKLIPNGTVLMSFKLSLGKTGIAGADLYTNEAIAGLIPKDNRLNKQYLLYAIQNGVVPLHIHSKVFGSSLNTESIKKLKIPLPPLDIQDKIVAEIVQIEKKEAKATAKIEKNQQKINSLFGKGEKAKIGDVLTLEYGVALPKNKRLKGEYPVVGSNGIDGYHNSYLIEAPSIIVGRKGSAGKVNWISKNNTPIDTAFYVKINHEKINLKYAFYILKSTNLEILAGGIGTPGLNRNDAYNVSINLPPLNEQQKIIAAIEPLEREIEEAGMFLASVKEQKQAILDKYLK